MFVHDLEAIGVEEFDLRLTLNCGQVFHWQTFGEGFIGVIGSTPVYLEQQNNRLLVSRGCSATVTRYLALDHPMAAVYRSFPDDPPMRAALESCCGLRIIRQPLWECLATFITSALKQVAHIAQISHCLRQKFGQAVGEIGGRTLFSYPGIERIATLQEAELRACGLGFRATSLLATSRRLTSDGAGGEHYLDGLRASNRPDVLASLTSFRGVGTKVANCVLLFGYGFLDAFPIDVWIERVLREKYFRDAPDTSLANLQSFSERYFGPYRGYAQQYLFHHARVTEGKTRSPQAALASGLTDTLIRRVRRSRQR